MNDIATRSDIDVLLTSFYQKALADPMIGYIFREAPGFHLQEHLPIIASFWESILFATAGYKGNPILKHIELHKQIPLRPAHFERWLQLWEAVVHENFRGTIAENAITKAQSIAYLMQQKIARSEDGKNLI